MSEVVVRMAMPKRCYDCNLADGAVCMATGGVYGREVPKMTWIKTRPSWCPIIGELPEHGDLIDRDHFKENLDMVCDAGGWLEPITQAVRVYCKKQVDAEETIVPAAERSET